MDLTKPKRIFVSNRLPYTLNAKTQELVRGSGGLVSALMGVSLKDPFSWFGFETQVLNTEDFKQRCRKEKPNLDIFPVILDKKIYDSYYDHFANDVLWPLFHYESQNAIFVRSHWENYVQVNQIMADAILKEAGSKDTIWIHDFHFLLLPKMLKDKNPQLKVGLFLHVPFPSSEIFRQLPVRKEILEGMIHADLLGFHEHSYLRHFTTAAKSHLGVDTSFFKAQVGDHILKLGVYPISIDVEGLKARAQKAEVTEQTQKYYELIKSKFLVLGVDRLDYSKGIELKLRGLRRAFQKYPELQGKMSLLQVAVPTRTNVPSYIRLKRDVDRLVGTINGEFGQPGYAPVQYIFNSVKERQLLALYRRANCVLVTSKRDGMNLVTMEYVISQSLDDAGIVILSEFAGVASLLGEALIINPWDEDMIADSLYQAYHMPLAERKERLEGLQTILSKYSATQWAESFLNDLETERPIKTEAPVMKLSVPPARWPEDLYEKINKARKIRLVLDYDGTLVRIHKKPGLAVLPSNMGLLLRELQEKIEIFIVSGRSKKFLDQQFPDADFLLAAEHGAFWKLPGEEWRSRMASDLQSWFPEVEKVMQAYADRVPLSFVEQKEASLVWHFRESPQDFANFQARKLDEELQVGLANHPVSVVYGNKIVEVKAIECNKGSFLRSLIQQDADNGTFYICMGDDRTDEDMFRAVSSYGISVKIGQESTSAQYRILSQEDVILLLRELLHVVQEKEKAGKRVKAPDTEPA